MTTLRPVDRWEWLDLIRRARLGRTTKLVAVMLALYANEDGSRVFPGLARLAVVCELGYNTVKGCLADLRDRGWIEQVGRQRGRGRADEYRLTVRDGEDVPTPSQIDLEIEKLRSVKHRVRPTKRAVEAADEFAVQPTAQAVQRVDNSPVQPAAQAVRDDEPTDRTAHGAGPTDPRTARLTDDVRPAPWAATNHVPRPTTTPDHPQADLRTAITVSRVPEAVEDPISDDGGKLTTPPTLRLVASNPDPSPDVIGTGWSKLRGHGFCVPCYADGQAVVAADPVNGAACAHHLRTEAS